MSVVTTATTTEPRASDRARLTDIGGFVLFMALCGITVWTQPRAGLPLIPVVISECVMALGFLVRGRARMANRSPRARLAAYAGTFLMLGFAQLAATVNPDWLTATSSARLREAGAVLWLAGISLSLVSLWTLRRSFSVEAAARTLVTRGPYRFARHPVYTGYILYYAGTLCLWPSVPLVITLTLWFVATLARVRFEEEILSRAFPDDYARYRRRVGAFGPIPQRREPRAEAA